MVILGAGESGTGAALLAKAKGHKVFVSDLGEIKGEFIKELRQAGIDFEQGQHTEDKILAATEVVKSPGIPENAPLIQKIRRAGIPVMSEIAFAGRYTDAKLIGITGTNGKTTTSLLTYHLLKEAGYHVGLAGNVGKSFARQVLENDFDWYVLELSSFQLDDTHELKLDMAVLLNITPDHLDRYQRDFEKYIASKMHIFQLVRPKGHAIYWQDDANIGKNISKATSGLQVHPFSLSRDAAGITFIQNNRLFFTPLTHEVSVPRTGISIKGQHNLLNAAAAGITALLADIDEDQLKKALGNFKNAAHRLEWVGTISDVQYFNDSKATNVHSVFYALEAFDQPVIWIAGGVDKGNDYSLIEVLAKEKVKALICLGKDNSKLIKAFDEAIPVIRETDDLIMAVRMAKSLAEAGDVVLLSPACASFDLFKNYEDRGIQFTEAVKKLKGEKLEARS